jgi:effector-binding domain-containing protein
MASKEFKVERSVVVSAPADIVFRNINSWDDFIQWNPWNDLDPTMKIETEGTNGTVGSIYKWEGSDKVGKGRMVKTLVDSNNRVEYDLIFTEPWEDKNKGFMTMEAQGDTAYKVSWGFAGKNSFPFSVMSVLMNMDAMLGKDFEKGLNKLKARAEAIHLSGYSAPTTSVYETTYSEKKFAIIRDKIPFDKIDKFFSTNIPIISKRLADAKVLTLGHPHGIYYVWDTEKKIADMAVAFPLSPNYKNVGNLTIEIIPASTAFVYDLRGSYEKMESAHNELGTKLKEEGFNNPDLVLEEYIVGPQQEKDSTKWHTKIYYLVNSPVAN